MRNPYIAGDPPCAKGGPDSTLEDRLTLCSHNTGNLLFSSAARRVIEHSVPSASMISNPHRVREEHDGIVIPAANWLKRSSDLGDLAELIEVSGLPAVIIGLGAQSFDGSVPRLTPGTLRLMKVLSERAASLSVRGAFTAEVLAHYGIHNVDVTGCPSLLWHVTRPARIDRVEKPLEKISLAGTRSDRDAGLFKNPIYKIGLHVTRLAYRAGVDYLAQTEFSDMKIGMSEAGVPKEGTLEYLSQVYDTTDTARLESYLRDHLKVFFDVSEWISYASGVDLTIGTRLHGTIAALLAGRPAVLIAHDTRTREMAEHAGIPMIEADEVLTLPDLDPRELMARVDADLFNRRQVLYYGAFRRFFDRNGVAHRLTPFEPLPRYQDTEGSGGPLVAHRV